MKDKGVKQLKTTSASLKDWMMLQRGKQEETRCVSPFLSHSLTCVEFGFFQLAYSFPYGSYMRWVK